MFDLCKLREACDRHARVARVVVAAVEGSAPREAGAAMLVWEGGQSGSIGGGALEWEAAALARGMLAAGGARVDRMALGPSLGQCCGGAVTLVTEVYGQDEVDALPTDVIARSPEGRMMPLATRRILDRARAQGKVPHRIWAQGWLVEPVARPTRQVWVWGAGHVGRAIVAVLAPLPGLAVTWVDVAADRFPGNVPPGVTVRASAEAGALVALAPAEAEHLVLTFSHALDLELCNRLLSRGFHRLGLIGSATKHARFRSRLAALGHSPAQIDRIRCPIGNPALGKHPQAIAVGVAAEFLAPEPHAALREDIA